MKIKKLSDKAGITEQMAYKMMGMNHLYEAHYDKKILKKVELELDSETLKQLLRISKILKISLDAVIATLLVERIKREKV